MAVSHWLEGSSSYAGVIPEGTLEIISLVVPAGGMMVKFLVRRQIFQAFNTGGGYNAIGMCDYIRQVMFGVPGEGGKVLYQDEVAVPFVATSLYDSETSERIYTQYFNGGDKDFLINQHSQYGKFEGTEPFEVSFVPALVYTNDAEIEPPHGVFSYQFAVLYMTSG